MEKEKKARDSLRKRKISELFQFTFLATISHDLI